MNVADATKTLEKNTGVNFGKLNWAQVSHGNIPRTDRFTADLTNNHVTGIFPLLFKKLTLITKQHIVTHTGVDKVKDFTCWEFEFDYIHPKDSHNGYSIGKVYFLHHQGIWEYQAA